MSITTQFLQIMCVKYVVSSAVGSCLQVLGNNQEQHVNLYFFRVSWTTTHTSDQQLEGKFPMPENRDLSDSLGPCQ